MLSRLILLRGFITPRHEDREWKEKEEQGRFYFISPFFNTLYRAFDVHKASQETKLKKLNIHILTCEQTDVNSVNLYNTQIYTNKVIVFYDFGILYENICLIIIVIASIII